MKFQLAPIIPSGGANAPASHLIAAESVAPVESVEEIADAPANPVAGRGPLSLSSPVATATAMTNAFPYALDERDAADEAADERAAGNIFSRSQNLASGWRLAAVHDAYAKLGTRYRWGGEQPGGFDCSGFVQYVMRRQGIELPRTAREMRGATRAIGANELKPGDLVFFHNPDHVGIYIGDKMFVHASSGRGQVTISTLDGGYYQRRYIGSGRAAE